jgi:hypothetical protein
MFGCRNKHSNPPGQPQRGDYRRLALCYISFEAIRFMTVVDNLNLPWSTYPISVFMFRGGIFLLLQSTLWDAHFRGNSDLHGDKVVQP